MNTNSLHAKKSLSLGLAVLFLGIIAVARVTGPEPRFTAAPGDINSCVQCHDTYHDANVGPGSMRIDGVPAVYEPGLEYTLRIAVEQAGRARFGFQLTAIDDTGNRMGSLRPIDEDAQINSEVGLGYRQYAQHTERGTSAAVAGSRMWQVPWIAPQADRGPVRFYAAGNAANGDGTNQDDYIYTGTALSESPSSVVTVTLLSQTAGLTLEPGSKFTINWSATNSSSVESYELRYSTNDGMSFPISQLIMSTADSSVTSYEWTIPNTTTALARIRLQATTVSGAAVVATSGRFSMGQGGATPTVKIAAARIAGKKLFVSGEGFQVGAVVEIDGEDQRTVNLGDLSRELKCKKAGKRIVPGVKVLIVVRNPDNTRSDPFEFIRPPD